MDKNIKKIILAPMNMLYKINPKLELSIMFYLKHGYKINFKNPKTFNEKLNWMKLNYRNELLPKCSDKYMVREYVKECGCEELLTNLLWSGYDANNIPFDELPDKFVLKVTHGSGNNIICKDKTKLDINKTISDLNKWLKEKYLPCYGEWFYDVIKPRIIVEEFLSEDGEKIPVDYKMYCFNNINNDHNIGFTAVHTGRFGEYRKTLYDYQWNIMNDIEYGFKNDIKNIIEKPKLYDDMLKYAKKLSKPFPHARVDFYIIKNKLYFGEITFMTGAGFNKISPKKFDEKIGEWIDIHR